MIKDLPRFKCKIEIDDEARIKVNKKEIHLEDFATEELAALAYNEAAIKYFGKYACLNVIK